MKPWLRAAMLVCAVALSSNAWLLPVSATSNISAGSQAARGYSSFGTSGKLGLPTLPGLRGSGEFTSVAAVLASDIWAVGSGIGTLTEHWDGTQPVAHCQKSQPRACVQQPLWRRGHRAERCLGRGKLRQ